MAKMNYTQAVVDAIRQEMRRDADVVVLGVDVRASIFGTTRGLVEEFGRERVIDTPVCEGSFTMAAVGMAMSGLRPVVEIMFSEFMYLPMDAIGNMAASWPYISNGGYRVPLVVQNPCGPRGSGAYSHSQTSQASFLNPPGLKIVLPSTPCDAKGLMQAAIRDNGPVLIYHHRQLFANTEDVPEGDHVLPIGKAAIRRQGGDVTLISFGGMLYKCLQAAEVLAREEIQAEVIDLRTIVPLDEETLVGSLLKTNHLVVVEDGRKRGGIGSEVAAVVAEKYIDLLDGPILRVAATDTPVPYARTLEQAHFPDLDRIVGAAKKTLE
jgi:pyruvate/2-oxoglutarate/acetoin dehydrogenase E1 component